MVHMILSFLWHLCEVGQVTEIKSSASIALGKRERKEREGGRERGREREGEREGE